MYGRCGFYLLKSKIAALKGIVYFWQGNKDKSEKCALESESYFVKTDSSIESKLSKRLFGLIAIAKGDYDKAIMALTDVLETISSPDYSEKEKVAIFADWVVLGDNGYKAGVVALYEEIGIAYK